MKTPFIMLHSLTLATAIVHEMAAQSSRPAVVFVPDDVKKPSEILDSLTLKIHYDHKLQQRLFDMSSLMRTTPHERRNPNQPFYAPFLKKPRRPR